MSGSNYPDSTWAGDPHAPWNQPEPWLGRTCGECRLCGVGCGKILVPCIVDAIDSGDGNDVVGTTAGSEACESFEARS